MELLINKFLAIGYGDGDGDGSGSGYGSGSGDGYGYGSGSGDGYGDGYGYGSGSGDGYGDGSGDGDGSGLKTLKGEKINQIDKIPTIIRSVKGQIASGVIVNSDLTLTPCFIARVGDYFAHGDTIREALADATAKFNENRPLEDRIADFVAKFKKGESYPAIELRDWHKILTGACQLG